MKAASEWQEPHISGIARGANLPANPLRGSIATVGSSEVGSPPWHPAHEIP